MTVPDGYKDLYIGFTGRTFKQRMKEHHKNAINLQYFSSRKLYDCIRLHGFDSFQKLVLVDNLSEQEAKDLEIQLIARYDSYHNGLNSNPGGGCGLSGSDHPLAVSVNVYNNTTGDVHIFQWQRDAANYLGIDEHCIYAVKNKNNEQTYSPIHKAWFQIKRSDDDTPFVENMPTRNEKISGANHPCAQEVNVYNNTTGEITSFLWMRDAANYIGVDPGRVKDVVNPNYESEQTYSSIHKAWFQIKRSDDDTPFVVNMPSQYEKLHKPIVVFDIDSHEELQFDSTRIAAEYFGVLFNNIGQVVSEKGINKQFYANGRRYDAQKIPKTREWNMDLKSRKTKIYYIDSNNTKIFFESINEAARTTRGSYAVVTQKKAISISYDSDGLIPCKAGYKWYSGNPVNKS
jgi:predicted GIY-YIG superfamily endonuclease